jgi:CDP-4-dehydro-6-deoxyglucose reductase
MPELYCAGQRWTVAPATNLLDALIGAGLPVPYSCRAGSCHACLVRCVDGEPSDLQPDLLSPEQRAAGWRLACQCRIDHDLGVQIFDPRCDGLLAQVESVQWLSTSVLRLRLLPERPLRYRPGQHLLLWAATGIARPYSLASLPGEDPWLEFHLDCSRPGAFCDAARKLRPGDALQLGELHGGALHYEPDWSERPLLLLAAGTGLAPLWGVLRESLRQGHCGPIRLLHVCGGDHYLRGPLHELASSHPNLRLEWIDPREGESALRALKPASRKEIALLCGGSEFVATCARQLFLAGLPRGQIFSDAFVGASPSPPAHPHPVESMRPA